MWKERVKASGAKGGFGQSSATRPYWRSADRISSTTSRSTYQNISLIKRNHRQEGVPTSETVKRLRGGRSCSWFARLAYVVASSMDTTTPILLASGQWNSAVLRMQ